MKIQTVGRDDELTKLIWRHNHCTVLFFFEPLLVGDLTIRPLAQEVHLDHHWIFEIAENDPEYLLAMDEDVK